MPGSVRLRDCKTLEAITKKQAEENRLYGAICAAPAVTLLPWGLLKRKKVCIYAFSIFSTMLFLKYLKDASILHAWYGVLIMSVHSLLQTTCHPAFFHKLPSFRAIKTNLQVSEGLTTSRGPGTCFQFSVSLVEQLFGESASMDMGKFLVFQTFI